MISPNNPMHMYHIRRGSQLAAYSDCNRYLAVVHRIELQDHIAVYSLQPLQEISKFRGRSNDISCIQWLPGDTHLITIDSHLYYNCSIYTPTGEVSIFGYSTASYPLI